MLAGEEKVEFFSPKASLNLTPEVMQWLAEREASEDHLQAARELMDWDDATCERSLTRTHMNEEDGSLRLPHHFLDFDAADKITLSDDYVIQQRERIKIGVGLAAHRELFHLESVLSPESPEAIPFAWRRAFHAIKENEEHCAFVNALSLVLKRVLQKRKKYEIFTAWRRRVLLPCVPSSELASRLGYDQAAIEERDYQAKYADLEAFSGPIRSINKESIFQLGRASAATHSKALLGSHSSCFIYQLKLKMKPFYKWKTVYEASSNRKEEAEALILSIKRRSCLSIAWNNWLTSWKNIVIAEQHHKLYLLKMFLLAWRNQLKEENDLVMLKLNAIGELKEQRTLLYCFDFWHFYSRAASSTAAHLSSFQTLCLVKLLWLAKDEYSSSSNTLKAKLSLHLQRQSLSRNVKDSSNLPSVSGRFSFNRLPGSSSSSYDEGSSVCKLMATSSLKKSFSSFLSLADYLMLLDDTQSVKRAINDPVLKTLSLIPAVFEVNMSKLGRYGYMIGERLKTIVFSKIFLSWRRHALIVKEFKKSCRNRFLLEFFRILRFSVRRLREMRRKTEEFEVFRRKKTKKMTFFAWRKSWLAYCDFRSRLLVFDSTVRKLILKRFFDAWISQKRSRILLKIQYEQVTMISEESLLRRSFCLIYDAFQMKKQEKYWNYWASFIRRRSFLMRGFTALKMYASHSLWKKSANKLADLKMISPFFKAWLKRSSWKRRMMELLATQKGIFNYYKLSLYFKLWRERRQSAELIRYHATHLRSKVEASLISRCFSNWRITAKLHLVSRIVHKRMLAKSNRRLLTSSLKIWKRETINRLRMKGALEGISNVFRRRALQKWREYVGISQAKQLKFRGYLLVRKFKKVISFWRQKTAISVKGKIVRTHTQSILRHTFFSTWKNRFIVTHTAKKRLEALWRILNIFNNHSLQIAMTSMKENLLHSRALDDSADSFFKARMKKLHCSYFFHWKLWMKKKREMSEKLLKISSSKQQKSREKWFFLWKQCFFMSLKCEFAGNHRSLLLKRQTFGILRTHTGNKVALKHKAEVAAIVVRREEICFFFGVWRASFYTLKKMRLLVEGFRVKRRVDALQKAFSWWLSYSKHRRRLFIGEKSIQEARNLRIKQTFWVFCKNFSNFLIRRRGRFSEVLMMLERVCYREIFNTWNRLVHYVVDSEKLDIQLELYYFKRLKRKVFSALTDFSVSSRKKKWRKKKAAVFYEKMMLQKFTVLWLKSFALKMIQREKLADFTEKRDFSLKKRAFSTLSAFSKDCIRKRVFAGRIFYLSFYFLKNRVFQLWRTIFLKRYLLRYSLLLSFKELLAKALLCKGKTPHHHHHHHHHTHTPYDTHFSASKKQRNLSVLVARGIHFLSSNEAICLPNSKAFTKPPPRTFRRAICSPTEQDLEIFFFTFYSTSAYGSGLAHTHLKQPSQSLVFQNGVEASFGKFPIYGERWKHDGDEDAEIWKAHGQKQTESDRFLLLTTSSQSTSLCSSLISADSFFVEDFDYRRNGISSLNALSKTEIQYASWFVSKTLQEWYFGSFSTLKDHSAHPVGSSKIYGLEDASAHTLPAYDGYYTDVPYKHEARPRSVYAQRKDWRKAVPVERLIIGWSSLRLLGRAFQIWRNIEKIVEARKCVLMEQSDQITALSNRCRMMKSFKDFVAAYHTRSRTVIEYRRKVCSISLRRVLQAWMKLTLVKEEVLVEARRFKLMKESKKKQQILQAWLDYARRKAFLRTLGVVLKRKLKLKRAVKCLTSWVEVTRESMICRVLKSKHNMKVCRKALVCWRATAITSKCVLLLSSTITVTFLRLPWKIWKIHTFFEMQKLKLARAAYLSLSRFARKKQQQHALCAYIDAKKKAAATRLVFSLWFRLTVRSFKLRAIAFQAIFSSPLKNTFSSWLALMKKKTAVKEERVKDFTGLRRLHWLRHHFLHWKRLAAFHTISRSRNFHLLQGSWQRWKQEEYRQLQLSAFFKARNQRSMKRCLNAWQVYTEHKLKLVWKHETLKLRVKTSTLAYSLKSWLFALERRHFEEASVQHISAISSKLLVSSSFKVWHTSFMKSASLRSLFNLLISIRAEKTLEMHFTGWVCVVNLRIEGRKTAKRLIWNSWKRVLKIRMLCHVCVCVKDSFVQRMMGFFMFALNSFSDDWTRISAFGRSHPGFVKMIEDAYNYQIELKLLAIHGLKQYVLSRNAKKQMFVQLEKHRNFSVVRYSWNAWMVFVSKKAALRVASRGLQKIKRQKNVSLLSDAFFAWISALKYFETIKKSLWKVETLHTMRVKSSVMQHWKLRLKNKLMKKERLNQQRIYYEKQLLWKSFKVLRQNHVMKQWERWCEYRCLVFLRASYQQKKKSMFAYWREWCQHRRSLKNLQFQFLEQSKALLRARAFREFRLAVQGSKKQRQKLYQIKIKHKKHLKHIFFTAWQAVYLHHETLDAMLHLFRQKSLSKLRERTFSSWRIWAAKRYLKRERFEKAFETASIRIYRLSLFHHFESWKLLFIEVNYRRRKNTLRALFNQWRSFSYKSKFLRHDNSFGPQITFRAVSSSENPHDTNFSAVSKKGFGGQEEDADSLYSSKASSLMPFPRNQDLRSWELSIDEMSTAGVRGQTGTVLRTAFNDVEERKDEGKRKSVRYQGPFLLEKGWRITSSIFEENKHRTSANEGTSPIVESMLPGTRLSPIKGRVFRNEDFFGVNIGDENISSTVGSPGPGINALARHEYNIDAVRSREQTEKKHSFQFESNSYAKMNVASETVITDLQGNKNENATNAVTRQQLFE